MGGWNKSRSEQNWSPGGGPMYTTVNYYESCFQCGGTGQVYVPDPPQPTPPRRKDKRGATAPPVAAGAKAPPVVAGARAKPGVAGAKAPTAARAPRRVLTPDEIDERFAGYCAIAVLGSVWALLALRYEVGAVTSFVVSASAGIPLYLLLRRFKRFTRILRYVVALAIFTVLVGGSIYLLSIS